ncbi:MAG: RecQ family ATP-dependent DNA helicase [Ignavibacterium sp.]|nr:RecQ family ATP-dependent DNA helicase [Ignavibacterium sp.]MDW8374930.1 RecQ family ATP-dependent DNA helicase [Ignavibacteriales bacterium]
MKIDRVEAEKKLLKIFGFKKFFDKQWETIEHLLRGERILLIEKTGFGKSLCFQFPAILFDGLTIVFTPLIALMRDQVKSLNAKGISASCINSEQDDNQNKLVIEQALLGKISILYIAPERQENYDWIESARKMKISMVVIDEAHCISVWGHDFRPAYRRIINLVNLLPKGFPVLATTATATKEVEADIAKQMGGSIKVIRGNLMRENFNLYVLKVSSEEEKMLWLGKNLMKLSGTGIIYTGTRVNTEIYSRWLDFLNIPAIGYNAKLDSQSRIDIENGLMNNRWKAIVSTNALGMGIDKPDVRFIIHTQIPQSPIHYYQEIGRAGRDGNPTDIILFYSQEDKELPLAFIENSKPDISKYFRVIELIKTELLGEREIIKKANLKQTQFRVIKADLIDQGIIREVLIGKSKKYEYVSNAPSLDTTQFQSLREHKLEELEKMVEYVETKQSRMKFLCNYLGDNTEYNFRNCDNTGLEKLKLEDDSILKARLNEFFENYYPTLEVETKGSNLVNGVASSYYGFSNVGRIIHRCKYENGGDYPDTLVDIFLKAVNKNFPNEKFDLVVYVPPTVSGDLVKNFANKISKKLNVPISHSLRKTRTTEKQKVFQNSYSKAENVKDAFYYEKTEEIIGKNILLIDDIFDSGATIKEIGKMLTSLGARKITPIVIAKTVGGDLI